MISDMLPNRLPLKVVLLCIAVVCLACVRTHPEETVCYPGQLSCDEGKVYECSRDGSKFTLHQDCPSVGLVCEAGECVEPSLIEAMDMDVDHAEVRSD